MRKTITWVLIGTVVVVSGTWVALDTTGIGFDCAQGSHDLAELALCIHEHAPAEGSRDYTPPTAAEQDAYRGVVADMLGGACDSVVVPAAIDRLSVFEFKDHFADLDLCIAMEVQDADDDGVVDKGWSVLVVNTAPDRWLSIQAPHGIEDNDTGVQAARVFVGTGAHTLLMNGASRDASAKNSSTCQSNERDSDVAHNVNNLLYVAAVELDAWHAAQSHAYTAVQFHGMKATSCTENVYLTHGHEDPPEPTDSIATLRDELLTLRPSWIVGVPAPGSCGKNGTNSTPGRHLNGLTDACADDAPTYDGTFVHVEQHPGHRDARVWIEALRATYPAIAPPAATTATFTAAADTWVDADDPDDNFGPDTVCDVDGDPVTGGQSALVRWDVSTLPAGATVLEATVTLDVTNATNETGYYVWKVAQPWTEAGATWNEYAAALSWELAGAQGDTDRLDPPFGRLAPESTGLYTRAVNPAVVQSWIGADNHGILIQNTATTNGMKFRCSGADAPKLAVTYSL